MVLAVLYQNKVLPLLAYPHDGLPLHLPSLAFTSLPLPVLNSNSAKLPSCVLDLQILC